MRIALTLSLDITRDKANEEAEPGPSGSESLVEHANHDSTPRRLGFRAEPEQEEEYE